MNNNLCLKWNNHSVAFLQSLRKVHIENCFCDATLVCQGIHFPVHRFVLSACSDYFEELFSKMQCQHPYVVFKDIDSGEMELLLNYMYHGEVNVLQEKLPTLIQGAETLRLKGLAVPDDPPPLKESKRKRSCARSSENFPSKGRSEERKRHRDSQSYSENDSSVNKSSKTSSTVPVSTSSYVPSYSCIENNTDTNSVRIKDEPLDSSDYRDEVNFSTMTADEVNMNIQNIAKTGNFIAFPSESDLTTENEDPYPSPVKETNSVRVKDEPLDSSDYRDEVNFSTMTADEVNMNIQNDAHTINFVAFPENEGTQLSCDGTPKEEQWKDVSEVSETIWPADVRPEEARLAENIVGMRSEMLPSTLVETGWKGRSEKRTGSKRFTRDLPSDCRKCPYCDYRNIYQSGIKRHIRFRHTNERPFACSFCGKRFVEKIARERHLRVHTGVKPYQCATCSKRFCYSYGLTYHLRRGGCSVAQEQIIARFE